LSRRKGLREASSKDVPPGVAEAFNQAAALHMRGRLAEAERAYREVLTRAPGHVDALHLLGVLLTQTQRLQNGVELIDKALRLQPTFAEAHGNRGGALRQLKRPEEALASYDKAVALKPAYVDAHCGRGIVLRELGRLEEALASYDAALALRPDYAEAHNNRGNVLRQLNRLEEAAASYDKAIALRSNFIEALLNRANVLCELHRLDDALASVDAVLRLMPKLAEAHSERGKILRLQKRFEEAATSFDRAIALRPNFAEAYLIRGSVLRELDRLEDALASCEMALALKPDDPDALKERGNMLMELQRPDEALASYDRAIALKSDFAQAYCNRGSALQAARRLDEAIASFDRALELRPDFPEASLHKGATLLLQGRFEEGWRLYQERGPIVERIVFFARRLEGKPRWLGAEPIAGKTLFVHWEQGFGDTILFSRYLRRVERLGARVIFSAPNPLRRLLATLPASLTLVDESQAPDDFDFHCPLASLPLALGTTGETIPWDGPYLRAEGDRVAMWRNRLGDQGFKIGVAWQGSFGRAARSRSVKLEQLFELSQIENVRLISLQKNYGAEQLDDLPAGMKVETLGEDYDAGPDAFLDTAAIMESLDLVISPDTAIAHLAGALGRPTWIALQHVPDWRWMLDRDDSPWYPTLRLFRQDARRDWSAVFARMASELRARRCGGARAQLGGHAPQAPRGIAPRAPVSWGELIDKITILEIKVARLVQPAARANAQKELALLRDVATSPRLAHISEETTRLREVNEALWEVEEKLRDKERRSEFDAEFIALARSVYRRNDERAVIKRRINTRLESELVEEKSYKSDP